MPNGFKLVSFLLLCVCLCLIMLRLGFWQLDRAEQKRVIYQQQVDLQSSERTDLGGLLASGQYPQRFLPSIVTGAYLPDATILIDNQVANGRVGYHVITPFSINGSDMTVAINRGWVSVGDSREQLPDINTPAGTLTLQGDFNIPLAQPPLWDDKYPVNNEQVWQYLPMAEYARKSQLTLLPLVLELAPDKSGIGGFLRQWREPDISWVNKHQGYAFQWFAMAATLLVLVIIILIMNIRQKQIDMQSNAGREHD